MTASEIRSVIVERELPFPPARRNDAQCLDSLITWRYRQILLMQYFALRPRRLGVGARRRAHQDNRSDRECANQ